MKLKGMVFAFSATLALVLTGAAQARGGSPIGPLSGHQQFMAAASENARLAQVRLPMYTGTDADGGRVWFVVTDASSPEWAARFGANFSPKLANAGSGAMHVTWSGGLPGPVFPFTPNFGGTRAITPGTQDTAPCPAGQQGNLGSGPGHRPFDGLPVKCFSFIADGSNGQNIVTATGDNSYSPLIRFTTPTGETVVLNAPQIANSTGQAGKVLRLEGKRLPFGGHVLYVETAGIHDGRTIHYVSFDSSIPILAALENITFAPAMNRTPSTPHNDTVAGTARSGLIPFTNGPTGLGNPQRQGINSAIFDGASTPLNVIQFTPNEIDPAAGVTLYSPMWDIHLATWKDGVTPTRQTNFDSILANPNIHGELPRTAPCPPGFTAGPDGLCPVHPVRFWMVNCPLVSTDAEGVFFVPPPT